MKRVLMTLITALVLCLPSFADDLNFSAFRQTRPSVVSGFELPLSYNEAVDLAKKTGKIIVVTKDVDNDTEIATQCEKDGSLYVNVDGDSDFHVGLSKLEYIGGKILYIELPSTAFPDRPQGVQYKINRDAARAEAAKKSRPGKVLVPQSVVEINVEQPVRSSPTKFFNMDGTPYTGSGVIMESGPMMGSGSCGPGG